MSRRIAAVATTLAVVLTGAAAAQAATPELSVSTRLPDRRAVAAGQRSYIEDFADGRFYANGFHIAGEMGGVWAPPVQLLDGIWFGLDETWLPQASRFTSGWGYTRYSYPNVDGLTISRLDFAPDAHRAGLFRLTLTNPGVARTVTVTVDATPS